MTASRTLTALSVVTAMLVPLVGFSAPVAHAAVESPTTDLVDDDAGVPETTETELIPDLDSETAVPVPSDVPYLAPTLTDQGRSEESEVVGSLADIRADLPFTEIIRQPTDQHVTEGENFNISVGFQVSGPGRALRQFSDDEGQTWRTIATTIVSGPALWGNHYVLNWTDAATAAHDGRLLRGVIEVDGEESLISDVARMTVDPLPLFVESHPESVAVLEGQEFRLTTASGTTFPTTQQWELSDDGGTTWDAIDGETDLTLSAGPATLEMDGWQYRVGITSATGSVWSDAATLTVGVHPPVVNRLPLRVVVDEGQRASFTGSYSGTVTEVSAQWELSLDGGETWADVPSATGPEYTTLPATPEMNGSQYRVRFSNSAGSAWSTATTLYLRTAPVITLHPDDVTTGPAGAALFTANGQDPSILVPVWQYSPDGAEWIDLDPADNQTHGTSIAFLRTSPGMDGMRYRAVYTNHLGTATSNPALLTVQAAPVISEHPTNTTVIEGRPATFSAATPAVSPNRSQQWQSSTDGETWMDVPGATEASLTTDSTTVDQDGTYYRIVFTNATGSTVSEPATLTVHATPPGASLIVTPMVALVSKLP